jgi:hypothetical protein
VATRVNIGNGKKTNFWAAAWFKSMWSKDIAPLIFGTSKKRKCMVHTVKYWWIEVIHKRGQSRKVMALLAIPASWEI